MKNYYEILEVNPKASKEIIEKAYKVLIKKYHPDLYKGESRIYAEEQTRQINEAYKILSDEFLREQYNKEIEKENMFNRQYNSNYNNLNNINKNTKNKNETENNINSRSQKHQVGTFMGMIDLLKEIWKNRPKIKEKKQPDKKDMIAAGLTAIIVITLGIILWFIPATHGFVRSLIPF